MCGRPSSDDEGSVPASLAFGLWSELCFVSDCGMHGADRQLDSPNPADIDFFTAGFNDCLPESVEDAELLVYCVVARRDSIPVGLVEPSSPLLACPLAMDAFM
jgi:hypothetical protein